MKLLGIKLECALNIHTDLIELIFLDAYQSSVQNENRRFIHVDTANNIKVRKFSF